MNTFDVYHEDGDGSWSITLEGVPMVGDVILIEHVLYEVTERRWSSISGKMELIVTLY